MVFRMIIATLGKGLSRTSGAGPPVRKWTVKTNEFSQPWRLGMRTRFSALATISMCHQPLRDEDGFGIRLDALVKFRHESTLWLLGGSSLATVYRPQDTPIMLFLSSHIGLFLDILVFSYSVPIFFFYGRSALYFSLYRKSFAQLSPI